MGQRWINPGKWKVNPANFVNEVWASFNAPDRCLVLDSTIRKMTGTPGCDWTVDGAVKICKKADEVGVDIVEINVVHGDMGATPKLLDMFEALGAQKFNFSLFGTARCNKLTIDHVADRGGDGVRIGGDRGLSDHEPFNSIEEAADYARSRGLRVATGLGGRVEDVSPKLAADLINSQIKIMPEYIAIHENTGATTPEAWRWWMSEVCRRLEFDVPIIPHIHNMTGLAAASVIGAVTGGAGGVDVSMNGIAIHCGLAALEDVVVSLEMLYGIETNIDMTKLNEYSKVVQIETGIPVHPNKSIVGEHAFICELESFVKAVLEARERGAERIHPFAPSMVGASNLIVWGENTMNGPATQTKLRQMGFSHDDATVKKMIAEMEGSLAAKSGYPRFLQEQEVEKIARDLLDG